MRLAATIRVLAGAFASQQLAFAHLLDAAERDGLSPDLDHVEVLMPGEGTRLRHIFEPALARDLAEGAAGEALILILPGALVTGRFREDARLRDLGAHPGHITRVMQ
ncbi:hypothetical protein ACK8OR_08400 [Jannaschia sp. KMU-145]|uniref:hypothetical protein n=1 Tax=Jannaschia halovivens TaxID=3388667 RepID=UPI00396B1DA1